MPFNGCVVRAELDSASHLAKAPLSLLHVTTATSSCCVKTFCISLLIELEIRGTCSLGPPGRQPVPVPIAQLLPQKLVPPRSWHPGPKLPWHSVTVRKAPVQGHLVCVGVGVECEQTPCPHALTPANNRKAKSVFIPLTSLSTDNCTAHNQVEVLASV